MNASTLQQAIQESQYTFPYHFLPDTVNGAWTVSRNLVWGYEYLAVLETITALVTNHRPKRVLDFGCGDGRLIYELYRKGIAEICGMDSSKHALLFSRAMLDCHDRVGFCSNFKDIQGRRFDVVTAMEVLEHIAPSETQFVLAGIREALVDDGCLIVSVPTKNIPLNKKHYRHFTKFDLEEEVAGLFDIERICFIHRVGAFGKILRRAVVNKFLIPQWPPWVNLTTLLYKRFVMKAQESDGAHLIAVLRKAHKGYS